MTSSATPWLRSAPTKATSHSRTTASGRGSKRLRRAARKRCSCSSATGICRRSASSPPPCSNTCGCGTRVSISAIWTFRSRSAATPSLRSPCPRPSIQSSRRMPWTCANTARPWAISSRPRAARPSPGLVATPRNYVANFKGGDSPRLSPSYTMLEFQRMQGDAQDYSYAYSGGNGTISGTDPGRLLAEHGTCRQELWPDESAAGEAGARPDCRFRKTPSRRDAASDRPRRCAQSAERRLSRACGDQHRTRFLRGRARRSVRRRRAPERVSRAPRHAHRGLHRKLLYRQKLVGRKVGGSRVTAISRKACSRIRIPIWSRCW